jgi:hypothetical protein
MLAALAAPSCAQDGYGGIHWDWQLGTGDPHKRYHPHYRPHVRYYREPEHDREDGRHYEIEARRDRDDWQCLDHPIMVLSTEHTEAALAMESAKKLWAATTQWIHGSRFMNLENAADEKVKCDQSNAMDTISGRLVEGAQKLVGNDGLNVRCVISARPCSAPLERAEKEDRR